MLKNPSIRTKSEFMAALLFYTSVEIGRQCGVDLCSMRVDLCSVLFNEDFRIPW